MTPTLCKNGIILEVSRRSGIVLHLVYALNALCFDRECAELLFFTKYVLNEFQLTLSKRGLIVPAILKNLNFEKNLLSVPPSVLFTALWHYKFIYKEYDAACEANGFTLHFAC
jgi:hypothetical protein